MNAMVCLKWPVYRLFIQPFGSGVDQRKHQNSPSLALEREIHRSPVNYPQRASNEENVSIWWRHHAPTTVYQKWTVFTYLCPIFSGVDLALSLRKRSPKLLMKYMYFNLPRDHYSLYAPLHLGHYNIDLQLCSVRKYFSFIMLWHKQIEPTFPMFKRSDKTLKWIHKYVMNSLPRTKRYDWPFSLHTCSFVIDKINSAPGPRDNTVQSSTICHTRQHTKRYNSDQAVQSSGVIMWFNIKYCIGLYRNWDRTEILACNHKRHAKREFWRRLTVL